MAYGTDLLFLAGLAATAVGLWLISPPLSLVSVGVVLMAVALTSAWRKSGR